MAYMAFLRANARLLGFGFVMTFFGAFGQTYFIAQYSADIRALYGLSHTAFGVTYAAATLTSAALLVPVGALIDRVDLRAYSAAVIAGLALAALLLAAVPPVSILVLYVAILLLRLCGQGLMGHIAVTTMARSFERLRGRALSLAFMGHSAAEASMPLLSVVIIGLIGWQGSWTAVSLLLIGVVLPLVLVVFLRQLPRAQEGDASMPGQAAASTHKPAERRDWTRGEMLGDWRFYVLLPAVLAPGFINTAIFFAQIEIIEAKNWTRTIFAGGFSVYAAATVAMAFVGGFLVDRFTAVRVFAVALLPLAAGMAVLSFGTAPLALYTAMGLSGASQGLVGASLGALWAELYGTRHLGAIRALGTSIMVFSTALAPALMGAMADAGVGIAVLALAFAVYAACAACLVPLLWMARPPTSPASAVSGSSGPDPR